MNLLCFTGSKLDDCGYRLTNPGLERVLVGYADYFDEVNIVCFSNENLFRRESAIAKNIRFSSYGPRKESLATLASLLSGENIAKIHSRYAKCSNRLHTQIRIPSRVGLIASHKLRHVLSDVSFYVAGDWINATRHNRAALLPLIYLLEACQRRLIRGRRVVTTGYKLASIYDDFGRTYPYFSTTHDQVSRRASPLSTNSIIYVGTFEKRKRVVDLVRALEILARKGRQFSVKFVGSGGSEESRVKRMANAVLPAGSFSFEGRVDSGLILKELYSDADILVLPSLSEGTPRVLPEAMASGTVPIAIEDVADNEMIIEHGCNGLLVPAKDPGQLAIAIENLLSNEVLFEKCLEGSYEYAEAHRISVELKKMWAFLFND